VAVAQKATSREIPLLDHAGVSPRISSSPFGSTSISLLVLEPCTGHPLSVNEGVAAGTHQVLSAGASRQWSLAARVGVPAAADAEDAE
jgi:hypothetical protein